MKKGKIIWLLVLMGMLALAIKYYSNPSSPQQQDALKANPPDKQPAKAPRKGAEKNAEKIELLDRYQANDAIHLYQRGEFVRAIELLKKQLAGNATPEQQARSLAYLAKCYEYLHDSKQATHTWTILKKKYPNSPYCGDANFYLALQAQQQGLLTTALQSMQQAAQYYQESIGAGKAALSLGEHYLKQGKKLEAWRWYSLAIQGRFTREVKRTIKSTLDPIVNELLTSLQMPGLDVYTVKAGDNLTRIARKYDASIGLIRILNRKKNDFLRVGERLKIIRGALTIHVSKSSYFLVVLLASSGLYLQGYEVGLGKNDKTPIENFIIKTKQKNPAWYTVENGKTLRIPPEDKRNVLGTRWMGFEEKGHYRGFGIHGTRYPESIGKNMSNGCVRMRNEEVEQLFEIIPRGTKVFIHP